MEKFIELLVAVFYAFIDPKKVACELNEYFETQYDHGD